MSEPRRRRRTVTPPPWLEWFLQQVMTGGLPPGSAPAPPLPEAILLGVCPPETLRRVWRVIVTDLHPDHGGDTKKMAAANAAWDEIRKNRGIR